MRILNVPDRIKAAEDVTFDGEKVPLIHNDDDLDNISNEEGRDSQISQPTISLFLVAVCGSLKYTESFQNSELMITENPSINPKPR